MNFGLIQGEKTKTNILITAIFFVSQLFEVALNWKARYKNIQNF